MSAKTVPAVSYIACAAYLEAKSTTTEVHVTQFDSSNASRSPAEPDFHTLIVGAGFSGIGAAIQLDKVGLGDYLIVEAGAEPGGTWYW
jgi:monoamine oxidase